MLFKKDLKRICWILVVVTVISLGSNFYFATHYWDVVLDKQGLQVKNDALQSQLKLVRFINKCLINEKEMLKYAITKEPRTSRHSIADEELAKRTNAYCNTYKKPYREQKIILFQAGKES